MPLAALRAALRLLHWHLAPPHPCQVRASAGVMEVNREGLRVVRAPDDDALVHAHREAEVDTGGRFLERADHGVSPYL